MDQFIEAVKDFEDAVDNFASASYFFAEQPRGGDIVDRTRREMFDAECEMVNAGEDAGVTWKMNRGLVTSEFAGLVSRISTAVAS